MPKIKSFFSTVALVSALAASTGANADLITEWQFTIQNNWNPALTTFTAVGTGPTDPFGSGATLPDGSDPTGDPVADYNFIRWGTPANPQNNRSYLGADTNLTVTGLTTGGPAVSGSNYYHGNYVLYTPSATREKWLTGTTLMTEITIQSTTPAGENIELTTTYAINFTETPNGGDLESCNGYPWPPSGPVPGTIACPDYFTIDISDFNYSTGVIDGYIYDFTVSLDIENAENLAGIRYNDDNTVTIWTNEEVRSRIPTLVRVTAREVPTEVPEPGALALAGAGLMLTGLLLRRRRSA